VFVAHSRAAEDDQVQEKLFHSRVRSRVWTSGVASWFRLAKRGLWVEGCAEGLGFEFLRPMLQEEVLQLPPLRDWVVLTHDQAQEGWEELGMTVVPTYRIQLHYEERANASLKESTHIFWTSGSQWDQLKQWAPQQAQHCCGPGKTALHLRKNAIDPIVFPSVEEWRKWLRWVPSQVLTRD
jgi:hypothetical protein